MECYEGCYEGIREGGATESGNFREGRLGLVGGHVPYLEVSLAHGHGNCHVGIPSCTFSRLFPSASEIVFPLP